MSAVAEPKTHEVDPAKSQPPLQSKPQLILNDSPRARERMRPNRLQNALTALGDAMREVNAAIEEMRSEHDPLASHIFVSRRNDRRAQDTNK